MVSSATTRARSTVSLRIMNMNPENNHKSSHSHKPSRLGRRCTKRAPNIGGAASTRRGATVIIATLAALCAAVGCAKHLPASTPVHTTKKPLKHRIHGVVLVVHGTHVSRSPAYRHLSSIDKLSIVILVLHTGLSTTGDYNSQNQQISDMLLMPGTLFQE